MTRIVLLATGAELGAVEGRVGKAVVDGVADAGAVGG